jgi:hypothetical protein
LLLGHPALAAINCNARQKATGLWLANPSYLKNNPGIEQKSQTKNMWQEQKEEQDKGVKIRDAYGKQSTLDSLFWQLGLFQIEQ